MVGPVHTKQIRLSINYKPDLHIKSVRYVLYMTDMQIKLPIQKQRQHHQHQPQPPTAGDTRGAPAMLAHGVRG
jgi:hypothetical protein